MTEKKEILQLPGKYSGIIQERLNKKGISVSKSLIHKVRIKQRNNMIIMKELLALSDELKSINNQ